MVDFEEDIRRCIAVLESGGTILYPTDTVWGLGCDATNEAAVDKVFQLKQRPKEKSLVVLLPEARDVLQYVAAPPPDIIEIVSSFETPTTVVYDGAVGFAENAIADNGSIAIRITSDAFCKALLKRFRRPLVSTSANISGQPTPAFFDEVSEAVKAGADYVVCHRQDDREPRQSSRIVRIQDDGSLIYLR